MMFVGGFHRVIGLFGSEKVLYEWWFIHNIGMK
jgi:hypothetical protein